MKTMMMIAGIVAGSMALQPAPAAAGEATDVSARMPELVAVTNTTSVATANYASYGALRTQENAYFKELLSAAFQRLPVKEREVRRAKINMSLKLNNKQQREYLNSFVGNIREMREGTAKLAPELIAMVEGSLRNLGETIKAGAVKDRGTLAAMADATRIGTVPADQLDEFNAMAATYMRKAATDQKLGDAMAKLSGLKGSVRGVVNYLGELEGEVSILLANTDLNGCLVDVSIIDHMLNLMVEEIGLGKYNLSENTNDYTTLMGQGSARRSNPAAKLSQQELGEKFRTR